MVSKQISSGCVVGLLLLAWTLQADAQDRRRPGERADRDTQGVVLPKATPRPDARVAAPAEPIIERRLPGQHAAPATVAAPKIPRAQRDAAVSNQPAVAPNAATTPAAVVRRRRPNQPGYTRANAAGERSSPGAPDTARTALSPNRASGLQSVAKPGREAAFEKHALDDRWQLTRQLGLNDHPWYDPYHQNTLKGDRPVLGQHWFLSVGAISNTVIEPRRIPTPVGPQGDTGAGRLDVIGDGEQLIWEQSLALPLVFYQGNTTFSPPNWEFRLTPVFNVNRVSTEHARVLNIDPRRGDTRRDQHVAIQELFVDKHLRNVSARYDFDSLRIGIQPFNADFRGFLFRDEQLGIRLFGNRDNNVIQYNLAWFRRLEKDTNSGLNDLGEPLRADDVFVANMYWQDFPVLGLTSQAVLLYNRNREGDEAPYFNRNGLIERPASLGLEKPRNYDAYYAGLNADGHIGRLNVTSSAYMVLGEQDRGVFVDAATDLRAFMLATELSVDFDWRRLRFTALYASGDKDPYDNVDTGFDAVFENVLFAGADTSFWVRQNLPLIGGGGVALSGRNGLLNSLRSSKEQGQSNFSNPGTILVGVGADFDLTPQWRVSTNINQIAFAQTAIIEAARQQANVSHNLGTDISLATIWRPLMIQNIILRASGAVLVPGAGYKALYDDEALPYSILLNLTLTW